MWHVRHRTNVKRRHVHISEKPSTRWPGIESGLQLNTNTEFLVQAYGCVHACLCVSLFAFVSKIARRIYVKFSTQGHFASR